MRSWEVQQALYAKLSGDSALSSLSPGGVFEELPADASMPVVQIGESTEVPDDLLNARGDQSTITIHVWDRQPSYRNIKQIMGRIDALLHGQKLVISGTQCVNVTRELADTFREPDGETRRGVMRFRVVTFG